MVATATVPAITATAGWPASISSAGAVAVIASLTATAGAGGTIVDIGDTEGEPVR